MRHRLVRDHAEELVLAERLREFEPVDVTTLAELTLLVRDGRSPLYAGGGPPNELTRVIARALQAADLR